MLPLGRQKALALQQLLLRRAWEARGVQAAAQGHQQQREWTVSWAAPAAELLAPHRQVVLLLLLLAPLQGWWAEGCRQAWAELASRRLVQEDWAAQAAWQGLRLHQREAIQNRLLAVLQALSDLLLLAVAATVERAGLQGHRLALEGADVAPEVPLLRPQWLAATPAHEETTSSDMRCFDQLYH